MMGEYSRGEYEAFGGGEPPESAAKRKPMTVSVALKRFNAILKGHTFRIEGEVSELAYKRGYRAVYFTVKDEQAALPCMMWKDRYNAQGIELALGSKVELTGKFSVYAAKGRMSFEVSRFVLAGEGDLRAQVARLAKKLKDEGLMDASKKRPLPLFPQTIGLVTSPRGAAVHDVLRTLRRRYPLARVVLAGINVEGARAVDDLISALDVVAASGAELVLLVRGGGEYESFMPFNSEALARAIASCPIPVVTGLGHEHDNFIADMVADVRASTPTGAALEVGPGVEEIEEALDSLFDRMHGSFSHRLRRSEAYLDSIATRPLFKDPASLFSAESLSLDSLNARLDRAGNALLPRRVDQVDALRLRLSTALPRSLDAMGSDVVRASALLLRQAPLLLSPARHEVSRREESLVRIGRDLIVPFKQVAAVCAARLGDLSPLKALERGWSIVTDEEGCVVRSVKDVRPDDSVSVRLADGALSCRVEGEAPMELSALISLEEEDD